MVRAALVTATSLALTGAVVAHAYFLKHQFYPTVVYLTKSSPSMAVRPVLKWSQILSLVEIIWIFSTYSAIVTNQLFVSVLSLVSGFVHSGLCVGVSAGKVHEEGLLWTTKGCRNGGMYWMVSVVNNVSNKPLCLCASTCLSPPPAASNWALLVRGDRDVPGVHCVQGRLLPSLRRPLHPPALP